MSNGDPNCERCHGRGALDITPDENGIPRTSRCECVLIWDVIRNVERGLRGLIRAPVLKESSPLTENETKNLWITSNFQTFKSHLRHVAVRQGPDWGFKVVTDADLMVAWLANASRRGENIIDPDVEGQVSQEFLTLVDLIDPPDLLIVRTGVKSARNAAMCEVFLEALTHRAHVEKPTWIVDSPQQPLVEGHLCWSIPVGDFLLEWGRVKLDALPGSTPANLPSFNDLSLSALASPHSGDSMGATKRVNVPGLDPQTQVEKRIKGGAKKR